MAIFGAGTYGLGAAVGTAMVILAGRAVLRHRGSKTIVTIGLALAILAGTPAVASAESWAGFIWSGSPDCGYIVRDLNTVGHPGMYTKGTVPWVRNGSACADFSVLQPPQHITVEQNLYAWNGYNSYVCSGGPPVDNLGWQSYVQTGYSWSSPPCGNWYYEYSGLWFRNSYNIFQSGWTTSGWNWVS